MPYQPNFYRSDEPATTPTQGDLRINPTNNQIEVYGGTTWAAPRFTSLTVDSGGLTVTSGATSFGGAVQTSAGFASTNAATPAFYIPGAAGVPTGAVASLAGRVGVYYDTTNNRLAFRNGGSWFATASLALL